MNLILTLNELMRLYGNTMAHGSNMDYLYFIERNTICVLCQKWKITAIFIELRKLTNLLLIPKVIRILYEFY